MKVENAVILAAGASSRFAPLSYERHKAMTEVKGEILIERQIKQIKDAGISEVIIVTGYKAEQFDYLVEKYGVKLVFNPEYLSRNNNGSIWVVREFLGNTFICSVDNYFVDNPFEDEVDEAYYASVYSKGHTEEWCMTEDEKGYISSVTIGGENAWYMMGHTFWSGDFTVEFLRILESEYERSETVSKLWEHILMDHLDTLKMRIKKYEAGIVYEFDTLDELRKFDESYVLDTRSELLKKVSCELGISESAICNISPMKANTSEAVGFLFDGPDGRYLYYYNTGILMKSG